MWKKENLRKNFLRVKQIADQNLGRAEKSEVLTEDQQGNEKRVDVVKQVSHNLVKKVTALLESPPGTDYEKRLRKIPETSLSHTLVESAALLGPETLMGTICQLSGDCQNVLAREELQCELEIEREVLTPLQVIAEIDFPSITKLRKQLSKSTLDMDSAKSRFNSAVRQSHVPGANMASAAAKADAVRDEYDEACSKVEAIKDNLSIELCNFISKESEHSSRLIALLEAQATYHKNALRAIEETIPKLKSTIESSAAKPMFGMSLEDHLRVMDRDISLVLEACILALLDTGLEEEGLFRIAGSALKMKKLKACFDAHAVDMDDFITDPHTVAGVLKQYLRELPEPMLTYELYHEFMQATQLPYEQKFQALYSALAKLPSYNYNNFRYLVKFLALLAERSPINKMTPSNIAIVMGPNLLWAKGENTPNMMTAGTVSSIIETFVMHADYFFPGEIEFSVTGSYPPDSPGQELDSLPMMHSSPGQVAQSSASFSASPVAANTSPSIIYDTLSVASDSPESQGVSPKVQRRVTKKPAPPPPMERPGTAAAASGVSRLSGNGGLSSQAGPPGVPGHPPDNPSWSASHMSDGEKRLSGTERPHGPPPERPNTRPPERPKAPTTLQSGNQLPAAAAPGGHQRSASTGAMNITLSPGSNAGSASHESLQANPPSASLTVGQGAGMPSGTATLGRHSTMRPARPQPPPPPPPINKQSEETHL